MKPTELSNSDFEIQVRKSYIKPKIERVSLVPEETVLGGCKTTSTGPDAGPGVGDPGCLGFGVPCEDYLS